MAVAASKDRARDLAGTVDVLRGKKDVAVRGLQERVHQPDVERPRTMRWCLSPGQRTSNFAGGWDCGSESGQPGGWRAEYIISHDVRAEEWRPWRAYAALHLWMKAEGPGAAA
jgi:3-methyladenine DNA glycosylase/8-oxoguanine DNA glycosylase